MPLSCTSNLPWLLDPAIIFLNSDQISSGFSTSSMANGSSQSIISYLDIYLQKYYHLFIIIQVSRAFTLIIRYPNSNIQPKCNPSTCFVNKYKRFLSPLIFSNFDWLSSKSCHIYSYSRKFANWYPWHSLHSLDGVGRAIIFKLCIVKFSIIVLQ